MQQFTMIRQVGTPLLKNRTLLFRNHTTLSFTLAPFSTCIRHHGREISCSYGLLYSTGPVSGCANHFHTTPIYSTDDQQPQNPNNRRIYVLWTKFATLIRNFTAGVKSLYSDVKLMNEYKQRHGNLQIKRSAPSATGDGKTDLLYSRKELQFMYRTRRDVRKMLPTVILFFIPFLGYFAPIIAFAYPERLLSQHFWTPSQRESLVAARRESQRKAFTKLANALKESNNLGKDLSFVTQMIDQYLQGSEMSMPASGAVHEISNFITDHQDHLYGGWGIRTLLPITQLMHSRLRSHLEFIFVSDWMIRLEGGTEKLSHSELVAACMERGLDVDPGASEDEDSEELRQKLDSWIAISTQYKECPSLLLAYLPVAQYSTS